MLRLGDLFDIGDVIRVLRERKGIKGARKIKKELMVDKDTLSRIERTSRFDVETLERIAIKLGTTAAELFEARDLLRNLSTEGTGSAYVCTNSNHKILHEWLDDLLKSSSAAGRYAIIANIALTRAAIAKGADELPDELKKLASGFPEPTVRVRRTKE